MDKNHPPTQTSIPEKKLTYYPRWLTQLQAATNYRGALTELSAHVAKKRGKEMDNTRPTISKIIKGHRQASPEYLLIIQEWMSNQPSTDGKK